MVVVVMVVVMVVVVVVMMVMVMMVKVLVVAMVMMMVVVMMMVMVVVVVTMMMMMMKAPKTRDKALENELFRHSGTYTNNIFLGFTCQDTSRFSDSNILRYSVFRKLNSCLSA